MINFIPITKEHVERMKEWYYPYLDEKLYMEPYLTPGPEGKLKGPNNCDGYAALEGNVLIGLFEVYTTQDMVEIGLALAPDQVGKGKGLVYTRAGLVFTHQAYNVNQFRLSVSKKNLRAIKVYKKLGFVKIGEDHEELKMVISYDQLFTQYTDRLEIGLWQEKDEPLFHQMNQDPLVMTYFPEVLSKENSQIFLAAIKAEIRDKGYGLLAVRLREKGEMIGFVGLHEATFSASFTPCLEIGWRFRREYWHKGYASEAARAILTFSKEQLGLRTLKTFTAKGNKPSIRLMERLGFTYEESFLHPKIEEGSPLQEHVLYQKHL